VVGSSALGDIYEPRARATALGWFLSGTLIGPAFGPFIGVRLTSLFRTLQLLNFYDRVSSSPSVLGE
jgi:MFS family permease